jgi:hypothetical protein
MADTNFTNGTTIIDEDWLNEVNNHVYNDTPVNPATTVHAASNIEVTPSGDLAATDVQAALVELQTDIDTVEADIAAIQGDRGDITVSGTSWTIDNDAVTFAKMQNITSDRLIGRDTASSGDPEEISVTAPLAFSGSGALTVGAASTTATGVVKLATTAEMATGTASTVPTVATIRTDLVVEGTETAVTGSAQALFTGIPSWATTVRLCLRNVSLSGAGAITFLLGKSTGLVDAGYEGSYQIGGTAGGPTTTAFVCTDTLGASDLMSGICEAIHVSGDLWAVRCTIGSATQAGISTCTGTVALGATLDRIALQTTGGASFDAGTATLSYF